MAIIFEDGFESGNFNSWITMGSPTIVSGSFPTSHHGSYAARIPLNSRAYKVFNDKDTIYARVYVKWVTNPSNGNSAWLFNIGSGDAGGTLVYVRIVNDNGTMKWGLITKDTSGGFVYDVFTGSSLPTNDNWHCVELKWQKNIANGAKLVVDGWFVGYTSAHTSDTQADTLALLLEQTEVTAYYDCAAISEDYIGPEDTNISTNNNLTVANTLVMKTPESGNWIDVRTKESGNDLYLELSKGIGLNGNVPVVSKQELVPYIWGFDNGVWQPQYLTIPNGGNYLRFMDTSPGHYNHYGDLSIVSVNDQLSSYEPLLTWSQGMVVKKDISVGGFVAANQGLIALGSGMKGQFDPPGIWLMHDNLEALHGIEKRYAYQGDPAQPDAGKNPYFINMEARQGRLANHLYQWVWATPTTGYWDDRGPTSNYEYAMNTCYIRKFLYSINLNPSTVQPPEPSVGSVYKDANGHIQRYDGSTWIDMGPYLYSVPIQPYDLGHLACYDITSANHNPHQDNEFGLGSGTYAWKGICVHTVYTNALKHLDGTDWDLSSSSWRGYSFTAGAAISANRIVAMSADNTVVTANRSNAQKQVGVAVADISSGNQGVVAYSGAVQVRAGMTLTAGMHVTTDDSGCAYQYTGHWHTKGSLTIENANIGAHNHQAGANLLTDSQGAHTHGFPTGAAATDTQGSHAHGFPSGYAATDSQGAHTHGFPAGAAATDSQGGHSHGFPRGSAATDSQGNHNHGFPGTAGTDSQGSHSHGGGTGSTGISHTHGITMGSTNTGTTSGHSHTYAYSVSPTQSGGGSHSHTISSDGGHSHTVGGSTGDAGSHSHNVGGSTGSVGGHAHAVGGATGSAGNHTHAVGGSTDSQGSHSHAIGGATGSAGSHSHSVGGYSGDVWTGTGGIGQGSHTHSLGSGSTSSVTDEKPIGVVIVGASTDGLATILLGA